MHVVYIIYINKPLKSEKIFNIKNIKNKISIFNLGSFKFPGSLFFLHRLYFKNIFNIYSSNQFNFNLCPRDLFKFSAMNKMCLAIFKYTTEVQILCTRREK